MQKAFIIPGYGVPDDIRNDGNYVRYLHAAFASILRASENEPTPPAVILSGGPTDMRRPFRRTEASEMKKLFLRLMKKPKFRTRTKDWKLLLETKSLSTLENLLYSREVLREADARTKFIRIFCEFTRKKRVYALAKKIFGNRRTVSVAPADFDQSSERFMEPEALQHRERRELNMALWALKSRRRLEMWHERFKDKFSRMRKAPTALDAKLVRREWEREMTSWMRGTKNA